MANLLHVLVLRSAGVNRSVCLSGSWIQLCALGKSADLKKKKKKHLSEALYTQSECTFLINTESLNVTRALKPARHGNAEKQKRKTFFTGDSNPPEAQDKCAH